MNLNKDDTIDGNALSDTETAINTAEAREYLNTHQVLPKPKWGWIICWVVIVVAFPLVFSNNKILLSIAVFGMIVAVGSLGMNILTGYTGQASLGHGFFLGVGAYTAAVLGGTSSNGSDLLGLNWSFLLWIPAAALVAGLIGAIVGPLALRLQGMYLILATVALVFIGLHLFSNLKNVTGGQGGRSFPAPNLGELNFATGGSIGPFFFNRDQLYYFLVAIILIPVALFVRNVMNSRAGRAFMAVRDREIAAELFGINLARTKVAAFIFSSALAGMTGALYSSYLRFAEPTLWGVNLSLQYVAIIIIGGLASVSGSIIGALLLTALPQLVELLTGSNPWQINFFPFVTSEVGARGLSTSLFNQLLYALFLILFLVFEPGGFIRIYRRVQIKLQKYLATNRLEQ